MTYFYTRKTTLTSLLYSILSILCVCINTYLCIHQIHWCHKSSTSWALAVVSSLAALGSLLGLLFSIGGIVSSFLILIITSLTFLELIGYKILGSINSETLSIVFAGKGSEYYLIAIIGIALAATIACFIKLPLNSINSPRVRCGLSAVLLSSLLFSIFVTYPKKIKHTAKIHLWSKTTHTFHPHVRFWWAKFENSFDEAGVAYDLIPSIRETFPGLIGDLLSLGLLSADNAAKAPSTESKPEPYLIDATNINTNKNNEADTIILIIGESSSSDHYSIYGYPKNTTPNLQKLLDKKEICILQKAHGASDMTRSAVLPFISLWRPTDREAARDQKNLIELAKQKKFKTFWLSATDDEGIFAAYIGLVARSADINSTHNFSNSSLYPSAHFKNDDELYPLFQKALKDPSPKKLIILHLWGSHWPYGQSDLNDEKALRDGSKYDRSVHHTDRLVANVIQTARESLKNKKFSILYSSDHGEAPNGTYAAHYSTAFEGRDFLVPFVASGTRNLCQYAETLRSPDGWYNNDMNKYIILNLLGYSPKKDFMEQERKEDQVFLPDSLIHSWSKYYKPLQ